MTATLIGYMAKKVVLRPEWLAAAGVVEICSVSNCVSGPPDGWTRAWEEGRLNSWGFFDRPEDAQGSVPEGVESGHHVFAYELEPARYVHGLREEMVIRAPGVIPLTPGFRMLGYDVVSGRPGGHFECSPLSCNSWSAEVGANRHCLVDDAETAHRLASIAEASACEPGDYFVVAVRRFASGEEA